MITINDEDDNGQHMGGNLLTVQSMKMISYFFLGHWFWQFRVLESQEMKYILNI